MIQLDSNKTLHIHNIQNYNASQNFHATGVEKKNLKKCEYFK